MGVRASPLRPPSPPSPPAPQLYRYRPAPHFAFPGRRSLGRRRLHSAFPPPIRSNPVKPSQTISSTLTLNVTPSLHHSKTPPLRPEFGVRVNSRTKATRFQPLNRLVLRLLRILAANQLKCLPMNHLHSRRSFLSIKANRAQSCLIVLNQGIFLSRRTHHSLVTPKRSDGGITPIPCHSTQDSRQLSTPIRSSRCPLFSACPPIFHPTSFLPA